MKKLITLTLCTLSVIFVGCGPSVKDVIKKYEGDFQKKRSQLKTVADALPPAGSMNGKTPCAALNPPLMFNEKTKSYNTEMVMYEELLDPDVEPVFDVAPNSELLTSLKWTGPKNPLSSSVLDDNGRDMEKIMKTALDYRYLVVNRVASLKMPTAIDEKTFSPGSITIEGFIVDLNTNKTLCNFVLSAETSESVSYYYKANESKEERLAAFAKSSMWSSLRKQMVTILREQTKGDIEVTLQ
jgi:hypothetical protein